MTLILITALACLALGFVFGTTTARARFALDRIDAEREQFAEDRRVLALAAMTPTPVPEIRPARATETMRPAPAAIAASIAH